MALHRSSKFNAADGLFETEKPAAPETEKEKKAEKKAEKKNEQKENSQETIS